jgi:hypothetical protein
MGADATKMAIGAIKPYIDAIFNHRRNIIIASLEQY